MTEALIVTGLFGIALACAWAQAHYLGRAIAWKSQEMDRERAVSEKFFEGWMESMRLAKEERRELLTRIQAWEPPRDQPPAPVSESQGNEPQEGYTLSELVQLGLEPNDGGGFRDRLNGGIWETVQEAIEYREILKKRGLKPTTHPDELME